VQWLVLTLIVVSTGNNDARSFTREGQAVARPMPVSAPVIRKLVTHSYTSLNLNPCSSGMTERPPSCLPE